jgi:hypothetical protein
MPYATAPAIYPFRWDITRPEQLGGLLSGPVQESYPGFEQDLLDCSAKIISLCDNADLYFVGRSPQSIYDLLSGLLFDTSWAERLHLFHFSMFCWDVTGLDHEYSGALEALHAYLTYLKLDPVSLLNRARPVVFVDAVCSGGTFGNLITLLRNWCEKSGIKWRRVQKKLRLIGIANREQSYPKSWRWQEEIKAVAGLKVKNITVSKTFWDYIGNNQGKISQSYPPDSWGKEEVLIPGRGDTRLRALREAFAIFQRGCQRETRLEFIRLLGRKEAVRHSWYRNLITQL